jgi:hypothetical protein
MAESQRRLHRRGAWREARAVAVGFAVRQAVRSRGNGGLGSFGSDVQDAGTLRDG